MAGAKVGMKMRACMFFSSNWCVERIVDKIAEVMRLKNDNNVAGAKVGMKMKEFMFFSSSRGVFSLHHIKQICNSSTRDPHVGFLSAKDGMGKTTKCSITFNLLHTTLLNYNC